MITVMNFGFHKMWIISGLSEELLATEERLCSSDKLCTIKDLLNCVQYRADKNLPPVSPRLTQYTTFLPVSEDPL